MPGPPPHKRPRIGRLQLAYALLTLAGALALALALWPLPAAPGTERLPADASKDVPPAEPAAPSAPLSGAGPHQLRALVQDDYGRPLPGAIVEAVATSAAPVARARTDDSGHALLRGLHSGDFEVRAQLAGHSDAATPAVAIPSGPGIQGPLVLVLDRSAVLRGRVLEPSGKPVAAAVVRLRGSGAAQAPPTAQSGPDGVFALPVLPAGVYGAQARLGTLVSAAEDGIELQPGAEGWVELTLAESARLFGRVVDRNGGAAIASGRLVLDPGALGPGAATQPLDTEGRFDVAGLRPGAVRLVIEAPGYMPVALVAEAGKGAPVEVVLDRAAAIAGRVVDESGAPVVGAELAVIADSSAAVPDRARPASAGVGTFFPVIDNLGVTLGAVPKIPVWSAGTPLTLAGASGPTSGPAAVAGAGLPAGPATSWQSASDGSFRLEPVAPGTIRVTANHPNLTPGQSGALELAPGGAVADVVIRLERGGMLVGEVRDAHDAASPGIAIELKLAGDVSRYTTVTNHRGRFELGPVRGEGVVIAHPPGQAPIQAQVEVEAGAEVAVLLRLKGETGRIFGEVSGSESEPLASAVVRVSVPDAKAPLTRTAVTDAFGRFAIDGLPLSTCTLEVEHPEHAGFSIEVVPGGAAVQVELSAGEKLIGTLRDAASGKPVAGAALSLKNGRSAVARARSNRQGSFEFRSIKPGEYLVIIESYGFATQRLPASIEADSRVTDLGVIELQATGSAAGQVVDRYGSVAVGAEVAPGDPADWRRSVRTDARGEFLLHGLSAGEHELRARSRNGSEGDTIAMRIEAGETTGGLVLRLQTAEDPADSRAGESDVDTGPEVDRSAPEAPAPQAPRKNSRPAVAIELAWSHGAVRVQSVLTAGARAAGLRPGDTVAKVDGEAVLAVSQGRALLHGATRSVAVIEVLRDGKRMHIRAPRETW